jgi:hypothetical protein
MYLPIGATSRFSGSPPGRGQNFDPKKVLESLALGASVIWAFVAHLYFGTYGFFLCAFFNLEKKSCPHAACASVLRACLFSLALFTGKALSVYGRAERSSQGALQVKARKKLNARAKQNRGRSHALASPPPLREREREDERPLHPTNTGDVRRSIAARL